MVVGEGTTEAEAVSAAASNRGDNVVEMRGGNVTFDGIFAVWRRTPFKVIVVVDIRSIQ